MLSGGGSERFLLVDKKQLQNDLEQTRGELSVSQASLEVISANKNLSDPPPMLSGEGVEAEKGEREEEVEQLKRTVEQLQKENTILKEQSSMDLAAELHVR